VPQTQSFFFVKVSLFFHFGHSIPLKHPKTPQILSQSCAKTIGSNDLGAMLSFPFLSKNCNWTNFGGKNWLDDHPYQISPKLKMSISRA